MQSDPVQSNATVVIRFKDIEADEELRNLLGKRCLSISEDFPETTHYELSLSLDSSEVSAHAHVSGRGIDLAAHASAEDTRTSGEAALDKLQRELRREHDKRIFGHRRSARKANRRG
jgi:ribosome-associated translation inhibitor RaiA